MNDMTKKYQFFAAVFIILVGLGYIFLCAFWKPVVDLTAPILGLIMLLTGYYWGSSKGSQDKADTMKTMTTDNSAAAIKSLTDKVNNA